MPSVITASLHRPSFEEILQRVEKFFPTIEERGPKVQLTAEDVVLCAGPKSGTTWVQQILHGLRSGGSMDYDDINAVIPMLEFGCTSGLMGDVRPQMYSPTMYKTHLIEQQCPKSPGKLIVLTRDPADAALSYYHYFRNWFFKDSEMDVDEFVEWFYVHQYPRNAMALNACHMRHLASWYPCRLDRNVLWLHYEDLKADLTQCIKLISDFTEIGVGDPELLALVERQASFEFMKKHASKFDSRDMKTARNEGAGLPRSAGLFSSDCAGKVRHGQMNESREVFSSETLKKLSEKWDQLLKPVTGFNNYEEMRAVINRELGREFSP